MKLAIATPQQVGPDWTPFLTEWLSPAEIRHKLHDLVQREETLMDAGLLDDATEVRIVSMNRTVIDSVTHAEAKNVGHMTYEDVVVWKESRGLVPLLELHSDDWLCHFRLGSLFERDLI